MKSILFAALMGSTLIAGAVAAEPVRYAGALTFAPDGTLFVGDNIAGAIHAIATGTPEAVAPDPQAPPLDLDRIDVQVAAIIGVPADQIVFNGMAVHPTSRDTWLSLSHGAGDAFRPGLVRVSRAGVVTPVDLARMPSTTHAIDNAPTDDQSFRSRAGDWPVPGPAKYEAKARTPMRSLTIVDMEFHGGELFVSGISNEEFASTLRRVPFPFSGQASDTKISIYHVAHERYETRAPIQSMTFATVDGVDMLVAGYTCSPLVLIPVSELTDGAQVTGRTIGDMGNGQPISMVPVNLYGQDMIFVTNMGHGPRMIPVAGLQNATVYVRENSPANYPSDLSPEFPLGPVGKAVMFIGSSLMADRLDDKYLVSLTRDARSGSLNLEALPIAPLPMKLDQIWSEFDFRGGEARPAAPAAGTP